MYFFTDIYFMFFHGDIALRGRRQADHVFRSMKFHTDNNLKSIMMSFLL